MSFGLTALTKTPFFQIAAVTMIEKISVGLTIWPNVTRYGRRLTKHAHRVASGRKVVDDDVFRLRIEIGLLDGIGQAALLRNGKTGCSTQTFIERKAAVFI